VDSLDVFPFVTVGHWDTLAVRLQFSLWHLSTTNASSTNTAFTSFCRHHTIQYSTWFTSETLVLYTPCLNKKQAKLFLL